MKLVSDEKLKNDALVVQLIELRKQLIEIWQKSMNKDPNIDLTIKFAFEKIVNVDSRVAKALVVYLDEMFKKDFKTINESDLNDRVDEII